MQVGEALDCEPPRWRAIRFDADLLGFLTKLEAFAKEWPDVGLPTAFWEASAVERHAYADYLEQRTIALMRLADAHGVDRERTPPAQCLEILRNGSAPLDERDMHPASKAAAQKHGAAKARNGKSQRAARRQADLRKAIEAVARDRNVELAASDEFALMIRDDICRYLGTDPDASWPSVSTIRKCISSIKSGKTDSVAPS